MSAIPVSDSLSNRPEQITEAANIIGRSKLKRSVFEAIYKHKKRLKSVTEIEEITGLTRMQILQNGGALAKSGLAKQEKTTEGICYGQIEFIQTNKKKILSLAGNPKQIAKIATKRSSNSVVSNAPKFGKKKKSTTVKKRSATKIVGLKIAFITANPDQYGALRTDVEARDVQRKIQSTRHRDQIEIKYFQAAEWEDFVEALNEFEPNVIHFSGHGGGESIAFEDNGGLLLDFGLIHRFIKATKNPPTLLVFNACDTVQGAEIFLGTVSAVIAMSDAIDDAAATFFATRFYSAIGNGQNIVHALEQGKASLAAEQYSDEDLPTLLCIEGGDKIHLIQ